MIEHPKTIQIDYDLFMDLYTYAARHAQRDDPQYKRLVSGVKKKMEALMRHKLYNLYKAGASEEIRENARKEYLDAVHMLDSFRWPLEQDVNVKQGKSSE